MLLKIDDPPPLQKNNGPPLMPALLLMLTFLVILDFWKTIYGQVCIIQSPRRL